MATYYGSKCKTNCDGHRAGASYVRNGGRRLTATSTSFNQGMRIAQKQLKRQGQTTRLTSGRKKKS